MYNEKVIEHFTNPRNVGEIQNPDGTGEAGSAVCGDTMKITIRVAADRIAEIRFRTFGCGAAIATSSVLTELVRGKTLDDALRVTKEDVLDALDGLPEQKVHCSLLAVDGLKAAIEDYRAGSAPGSPSS